MVTPHWLGVVRLKPAATLQEQLNEAFKDFVIPPPCSCNGETQCKAYDGVNEMSACPDNPHVEGDTAPLHPDDLGGHNVHD